jgi:hypothetical protein
MFLKCSDIVALPAGPEGGGMLLVLSIPWFIRGVLLPCRMQKMIVCGLFSASVVASLQLVPSAWCGSLLLLPASAGLAFTQRG